MDPLSTCGPDSGVIQYIHSRCLAALMGRGGMPSGMLLSIVALRCCFFGSFVLILGAAHPLVQAQVCTGPVIGGW